jgi:hypothetical protein
MQVEGRVEWIDSEGDEGMEMMYAKLLRKFRYETEQKNRCRGM